MTDSDIIDLIVDAIDEAIVGNTYKHNLIDQDGHSDVIEVFDSVGARQSLRNVSERAKRMVRESAMPPYDASVRPTLKTGNTVYKALLARSEQLKRGGD